MDARLRTTIEVEALHELLPELDYYRLLRLERDCSADEVARSWRRESRRFHPDRMAALRDPAVQKMANDVFRAMSEAHRVLSDPDARRRYDEELRAGAHRVSEQALEQARKDRGAAADPEYAATDPKAEKYWKMALRDCKDGNWRGAVMNIQFALNYEPDNATFKEWLEKAKAEAEEQKKKDNPYKLRIM